MKLWKRPRNFTERLRDVLAQYDQTNEEHAQIMRCADR